MTAQTGALVAAARRGVIDDESLELLAERTDTVRQALIEAFRGAVVDLLVYAAEGVRDSSQLVCIERQSDSRVTAVVPARGGD